MESDGKCSAVAALREYSSERTLRERALVIRSRCIGALQGVVNGDRCGSVFPALIG